MKEGNFIKNSYMNVKKVLLPHNNSYTWARGALAVLIFIIWGYFAVNLIISESSIISALFIVLVFPAAVLAVAAGLLFLIKKILKIDGRYLWLITVLLFLSFVSAFFLPPGLVFQTVLGIAVLVSVIFGSIGFIISGAFKESGMGKRVYAVLLLVIGLAGAGYLGYSAVTIQLNKTDSAQKNIISLIKETELTTWENAPFKDPGEPGKYEVMTLYYGSGTDKRRKEYNEYVNIRTSPVDISPFAEGWSGLKGRIRTLFWGFPPQKAPLNATVVYPEGEGPFPLVAVMHGNQLMGVPSEQGYMYLAKHLASRGYIVVLTDQNFLNQSAIGTIFGGIGKENDARAYLTLKHLELWQKWNKKRGNPFFNKVQMDRIGLVGHSRGGEAAAIAAVFNRLSAYPDNAKIKFNFNFSITGIAAIAPTDGLYKPAGKEVELKNMDYLVLQGARDNDVKSFSGYRQFDRVLLSRNTARGSTEAGINFKSAVYIANANHAGFNAKWGTHDGFGPFVHLYRRSGILSPEAHKNIAKVYITAFCEAALKKDRTYRALFRSWKSGAEYLPDTNYINDYSDSTYESLLSLQSDYDPSSGAKGGIRLDGSSCSMWSEAGIPLAWQDMSAKALYIGFSGIPDNQSKYVINLPGNVSPPANGALYLSISNPSGVEDLPIDMTTADKRFSGIMVYMEDTAGRSCTVPLNSVPIISGFQQGRDFLWLYGYSRNPKNLVFQQVRIPFQYCKKVNPAFNPERLVRIVLSSEKKQVIAVRDIGIVRP